MNVRIILRRANGTVWMSDTQKNPKETYLTPCKANPYLNEHDLETIDFLINNDVIGMTMVMDPKAKIVIRAQKLAVSVPLDAPKRKVTATGIVRITDALRNGILRVKIEEAEPRQQEKNTFEEARAPDLRSKVIEHLAKVGVKNPPENLINTCMVSLNVRGSLPAEILEQVARERSR